MEADVDVAAGVAALTTSLADNVEALKEAQENATSAASGETAALVNATKAAIMSDVDELDAALGKVTATLYGRAGRSTDETAEKGLLDLSTEGNALLEKIKEAVEAQLQTKTLPSARISGYQGCDPACSNGDTDEGYRAIGRDFIPVEDFYTCIFKTGEATPKEYVTAGTASSPNTLQCNLPALTSDQLPANTYTLELSIKEGKSIQVPYLGGDQPPAVAMKAAGPKVAALADYTRTLNGRTETKSVQIEITDPDSERFTFEVVQKGAQLMKDIKISDKGLMVYKLTPASQGTAFVTITVTDNQRNSVDTKFKLVVFDKIDDRIHVTRCSKIQMSGAGGMGGVVNGVYDRVPKFVNGWPQFCKRVNGKPYCYSQSYNARSSRLYSYGGGEWGVQTNSGCGMHHRYYSANKGLTSILEKKFSNIRGHGSSCVGGSNPTPTLKCLVEDHQRRIVDKAPIDTATCKKLVLVVGTSSMKYVGGVYGRCVNEKVTTIAGRPVWGKYQHDNNIPDNWAEATQPNCQGTTVDGQRSEIFWSESWGWGVSSEKGGYHHRFSECIGGKKKDGSACNTGEDANIMGQFLHVRPGYGAGPAPSLTCVEWL